MKKYAKALIGLSCIGALNAHLTTLFVRTKWEEHVSSVCDMNSYASCTSVITTVLIALDLFASIMGYRLSDE